MKYFRHDYLDNTTKELTHDEALHILLGTYRDNDMTRDMLTITNRIQCRYSYIEVVEDPREDGLNLALMPGLYNMLPDGCEYDESGTRI